MSANELSACEICGDPGCRPTEGVCAVAGSRCERPEIIALREGDAPGREATAGHALRGAAATADGPAETDLDRRIAALLAEADKRTGPGPLANGGELIRDLAACLRIVLQELADSEVAWASQKDRADRAEARVATHALRGDAAEGPTDEKEPAMMTDKRLAEIDAAMANDDLDVPMDPTGVLSNESVLCMFVDELRAEVRRLRDPRGDAAEGEGAEGEGFEQRTREQCAGLTHAEVVEMLIRESWTSHRRRNAWLRTVDAKGAIAAEVERLRAVIEGAPHGEGCTGLPLNGKQMWCTCWKSAALSKGGTDAR